MCQNSEINKALTEARLLARRFPIPIFQAGYRRVAVNVIRCENLVGDELEKLEADVLATVAKMQKWAGE